ncbi:GH13083 [Drosophila grimshawi]|uniref:GH13083 n=1 Tax=Drosophila grimshawi TaxID=7222 RepID=B4JR09_DROGR|nr:GH13083 [Drosophila grimshawi]
MSIPLQDGIGSTHANQPDGCQETTLTRDVLHVLSRLSAPCCLILPLLGHSHVERQLNMRSATVNDRRKGMLK